MAAKKTFLFVSLIILITSICGTVEAKSVFIISNHDYCLAEAFHIDSNGVSFQAMVDINTYNHGIGPVGVAVWPQKGLAFFTYEGSSMIVWSSTNTLEKVSELNTNINNLAGIAVDTTKQKIYVVQRPTANLYVYSWDFAQGTIVLESSYVLGGGLGSALGLALDESNSRLYVSDGSKTVRYYDTNTWAYQSSIDVMVGGVDRPAIGVAVDPVRDYLYTGYFNGGGGNSYNSLVRTNLTTQVSIETNIGSPVIGIDADKATGLVYCTTHVSDFRVYDSNLTLLDTETNSSIESPAGVAAGGYFGILEITKTDDVNDGDCRGPSDEITYTIFYGNPITDPCDPMYIGEVNDVNIIDHLPPEVDFNDASGDYNRPDSNTVIWHIGTLHPGDFGSVTLKVNVKPCVEPGSTIRNECEIKSGDQILNTAYEDTPVCSPTLIKVNDIPESGCVMPDANITYNIYYDANGYGDTDVKILDYLPDEVEPNNPLDPNYNPDDHTYTWDIGTLEPDDSGCVTLTVQVNTTANPLTGITNYCELTGHCMTTAVTSYESTHVCWPDGYIIYVDANAVGADNGTSWQNAFINLQDAIEKLLLSPPDSSVYVEIWVAAGTYKPDCSSAFPNGSGDPNATFNLLSNVAIYGGFPSGGGAWETREPNDPNNRTILSGDIGIFDSYRVVTGSGTDETAVLDGFTVTGGLNYDSGGGMYNYSGSPTVTNCTFSGNGAYSNGGGMYNYSGSPTVTNCTFSQNWAYSAGGGMYNDSNSGPIITNCTFSQNYAYTSGGGMYNDSNSNPIITNCTFSKNWTGSGSGDGGGIYNKNSSNPKITNCILWGNSPEQIVDDNSTVSVTYSDIQGDLLWFGEGNINVDPLFVDAVNGDLRLLAGSPCIDAGDNNSVPCDYADLDGDGNTTEPTPLDLDGFERFRDGDCDGTVIVDMGAYELLRGDINRDGFVNFIDFAVFASDWGANNVIPAGPNHPVETFESYTATGSSGVVGTLLGPRVLGGQRAWQVVPIAWYGLTPIPLGNSTITLLISPPAADADVNSGYGGTKAMRWVYDVNEYGEPMQFSTELLTVLPHIEDFNTAPGSSPYNNLRIMLKRHSGNSPDNETCMYAKFLDMTRYPPTTSPQKQDIVKIIIGGSTDTHPDEWHQWIIHLDGGTWQNNGSPVNMTRINAIIFGIQSLPEGPWGEGKGTIDVDLMEMVDLPGCSAPLTGDLTNDCKVNFEDLACFVANWLVGIVP